MSDLKGTDLNPHSGTDEADPRIGAVVDKYTIVRLLGKGGMGAVYEARHAKLSRRFAIKFLLPELAAKRDILRRFENEAKAAGGLEHANLVAVTDFGRTDDGSPYIVMEFLQGEDCSSLLGRTGPLSVHRAADIVVQACRGLTLAHNAGIVHRDLKPENLFLTDVGDGRDLVKVLDFGIAKLRSADGSLATNTGTTFGTAHYMSPEQARGASDVDQRTDVWALGVVLYELLSAHTPFNGDAFLHVIHEILNAEPTPLGTWRAGLPPGLVAVVKRAMNKDVDRRFPGVTALAEALAPFAKRPVTQPRSSAIARSDSPTRRTPQTDVNDASGKRPITKVQKIVAAGVCTAVVVGFLLTRSRDPKVGTPPVSVAAPTRASAPLPVPPIIEPLVPPPVRRLSVQSGQSSDKSAAPQAATGSTQRGHKPAGSPASPTRKSVGVSGPTRESSESRKRNERGLTIDQGNPY